MAIAFDFGGVSDAGPVRPNNEDAAYCNQAVLAVADGVGGGPAGELASSLVAGCLSGLARRRRAQLDDPRHALRTHLDRAHRELSRAAKLQPSLSNMATTLTAVLTGRSRELSGQRGGEVGLVHVGDSRLYVTLDDQLFQLTRDHSLPQLLLEQGRITPEQAERHPQRNVIYRSLRPGNEVDADLVLLVLFLGQRLILCSDGLSDYVSFEAISELAKHGDPQATATALRDEAFRCGSRDNVTVVVADVVEAGWLPPKELRLGTLHGLPDDPSDTALAT